MGCSQSTTIDEDKCKNFKNEAKNYANSSLISNRSVLVRSTCGKMKWGVILMIFSGRRRSGSCQRDEDDWLLANLDTKFKGDIETVDPQSVHSSFRFSFSSQLELDSSSSNSSSGATVLLMNLEEGPPDEMARSRSIGLKMQRVESLERTISSVTATLVRFNYNEIRSATNSFSKGRVLGRGALSCVFKGRLGFGRTVAIKRLDNEDKESPKAFCRELMIANSLDHRNVVPLIGFCIDQVGLFLVYKYISGGSLERLLHDKKRGGKNSTLSWPTRYKIAIGVAQAVGYLHYGTEKCVIHRDIKPSNILLSSKMTPKLCDFGLATWTPSTSVPFLCKTVKGTFGYLAPEYFQHGKVSDRTDVYAFGVVLLELISGRKPIETKRTHGDENLVSWAKPFLMGDEPATDLLDPQLKRGSYNKAQVVQMARAAAACLNTDESDRPTIDQVIAILRGDEHSTTRKPNLVTNGYGGHYPRLHDAQTKCEMNSHLELAMMGVMDINVVDDKYPRI
ncbi:probable serine/threonine-protein kinase PBL21 [Magnolia sinica]|uniref:probable serine/threonine-protein kinase PBL21 n=1 Tax=Magnolia sinica TaxID=86752 RepID=UPI00265A6F0F|nr:probable serine/threonine-protein kinase PBL21 [Magnolia sinica]